MLYEKHALSQAIFNEFVHFYHKRQYTNFQMKNTQIKHLAQLLMMAKGMGESTFAR